MTHSRFENAFGSKKKWPIRSTFVAFRTGSNVDVRDCHVEAGRRIAGSSKAWQDCSIVCTSSVWFHRSASACSSFC
jgi:hypothetical protein